MGRVGHGGLPIVSACTLRSHSGGWSSVPIRPIIAPVRVLFYKPDMGWPRSSGHDVHTAHMMRALADLGVTVGLATRSATDRRAIEGLGLSRHVVVRPHALGADPEIVYTWLQRRFASYWGPRQAWSGGWRVRLPTSVQMSSSCQDSMFCRCW